MSRAAGVQIGIRALYMRGGTSKGVFFLPEDLPQDAGARDDVLLRVMGSPDPYGKQIDGMGGATSSTSKVVIVGKSRRPDCDVDYLFGQVSVPQRLIDWTGNCGNLTSAVGPFALHRGLVAAPADGMARIAIWQVNLGKKIIAHVPVRDGAVQELGDFVLDGVTFPAARIRLEFLDPGAQADDRRGSAMLPTGNPIDTLSVPGVGELRATLINAGNPTIFVCASALGLSGTEGQAQVNTDAGLLARFESIRAYGAVMMGLADSMEYATTKRQHTPKLAFVAPPADYTSSSGKPIQARQVSLLARIISMGSLHHAMTGTGAVAIAAAAAIPGTVLARILDGPRTELVFGHPSGVLQVGAQAREEQGRWTIARVTMSRSARRLMDGQVWVPSSLLDTRGEKQ